MAVCSARTILGRTLARCLLAAILCVLGLGRSPAADEVPVSDTVLWDTQRDCRRGRGGFRPEEKLAAGQPRGDGARLCAATWWSRTSGSPSSSAAAAAVR